MDCKYVLSSFYCTCIALITLLSSCHALYFVLVPTVHTVLKETEVSISAGESFSFLPLVTYYCNFFFVCVFLFFFPSLTLAVKFQQLVVLCYVLDSVLKSAALKLRCQKCSTNFKINHDSFTTVKNLLDCFTNPTPDFSVCFLFHCSRTNTELFRLDILYLAA